MRSAATHIYDVAVIGGGPAGMMAAERAASRGRSVVLIEKNPLLGKKLLITGGGRCNVTNNTPDPRELLPRYKEGGKFLFSAFAQFAVPDTIAYFKERGVELKEENECRLFPQTESAKTICDTLIKSIEKSGVTVRTKCAVTAIKKGEDMFEIQASGGTIRAGSLIIATGGTSRPETGSTGDGFVWARALGHTTVANNFALVPVALRDAWAKTLGGVTLPSIKITLRADGKSQRKEMGKLLFTHFGVSGPTILNMSKQIGELLEYSDVVLEIDLFPELDHKTLRDNLRDLLIEESNKMIKNSLRTLVPSGLVLPLLTLAGIDGDTKNHSVRTDERTALVLLLKCVVLHPSGLLGAEKAVVSAGGVTLSEIDFRTMESRIVPRLFLIGDVLNIDRPSGGYSLQLCWTTGFVAGSHA